MRCSQVRLHPYFCASRGDKSSKRPYGPIPAFGVQCETAIEWRKVIAIELFPSESRKGRSLKANRSKVAAPKRVFLLSPANAAGVRAQLILREDASFPLARRLRESGLPLGEIFSFISGLYFRGKLAYAMAFAAPPGRAPGALVITASGGLISPDTLVTREELCRISAGSVDEDEPSYRLPLERDARLLAKQIGRKCEVVLLGSVATPKYVEPLLGIFGERLYFPAEFAGRGDMSRGGLMLRCVREGVPLNYVSLMTGARHGSKPPKLPKIMSMKMAAGNGRIDI